MIHKDDILQLIKKSVKDMDPYATLILYGSYVRGDYRDDSDIDLLVLIDKDKVIHDDQDRITHLLYRIELDTGTLISPMIYSKKDGQTIR